MNNDDLRLRLEHFKSDLSSMRSIDIARKHIVFGNCAVISQEKYFQLRQAVSSQFGLHPNEVLVVGSGKLGFSIAPTKRYRSFGDASDLDVVIVSNNLFDTVWNDLHRYSSTIGYWQHETIFKKYLFDGWIRPDKLPPDQYFPFAKSWWEFFNQLTASREYLATRITGALYRSWYFLESYQIVAIDSCARAMQSEGKRLR